MKNENNYDFTGFTAEERSIYILKKLIDDYLELTKSPTMSEILAKVGVEDKKDDLTKQHNQVLQCMVRDYYKSIGKDLDEVAKNNKVTLVDGELSDLEKACIELLLNDYCKSIIAYLNS